MIYQTELCYRRILCPVDFSEAGRMAFYRAVGYARKFNAELTILHVSERNLSMGGYEEVEEESELFARLEAGLVRRLDELQTDDLITQEDRDRMTLEIGGGKPWMEIVRYATAHDIDIIIMGTHGVTGFKHLIIGSQAERVVRRAPCDVICVKPGSYEAETLD